MKRIIRRIVTTVCCVTIISIVAVAILYFCSAVRKNQSLSADAKVTEETEEQDSQTVFGQMAGLSEAASVLETTEQNAAEAPEEPEASEDNLASSQNLTQERTMLSAPDVRADRVSSSQIELCWSDADDALIECYIIEKYDNRKAAFDIGWQTVGQVKSGEKNAGDSYRFTDSLLSTEPQQYVYRIIPKVLDVTKYYAPESEHVLCSNIRICIDPGHYAGKNAVESDRSYGYAEGDFTLLVSLELSDILKQKYGISTSLTRDSGSITLSGYTDEELDSAHISLRGSYAAKAGCDLFLSVHTNSNQDNANGAATYEQPVSINKPMVIANDLAMSSDEVLSLCNSIGENLAATNFELGTSAYREFIPASRKTVREWTVDYNDSTEEQGTVVYRYGSKGQQFYGVLRGAQESGVPGIIVEHGYHSVPEMRDAAMNGDLKSQWAKDDADGIAEGYGFLAFD